jgi:hypothetical protein
MRLTLKTFILATLLIQSSFHLPASAEAESTVGNVTPPQAVGMIDDLAKQILLKEIELQRFNLHYTLEVAKQGRWKGWRYAFFQEANTGMNLAGGLISTVNRGGNLHHASMVQKYPQEAANYIPMIGSIIGASAAATEFGVNGFHELLARKHGFAPATSLKRVKSLKDEIVQLMAQRQKLIDIEASDPALANHVLVDNAESRVLADTLAQALQEFARFHIGARKLLAFQQAQFIFDMAKYTTSAIGSDFAYISVARGKRIWNGRAGVLFVVSGQLTMWGPILSRLFAKGVGAVTRQRTEAIMREEREATIATLQSDLATLDALIKKGVADNTTVAAAADRQAACDTHEKAFENEIRQQEQKDAAAKLTATQNIAAGALVGGAKTASGVLFLIPGFNRAYNGKTQRSTRVTNDLLFASAVIGLPANTFSMLDTLRIQIRGEINRHRAAKAGQLPSQLAQARLKELEDIEQRLKAM